LTLFFFTNQLRQWQYSCTHLYGGTFGFINKCLLYISNTYKSVNIYIYIQCKLVHEKNTVITNDCSANISYKCLYLQLVKYKRMAASKYSRPFEVKGEHLDVVDTLDNQHVTYMVESTFNNTTEPISIKQAKLDNNKTGNKYRCMRCAYEVLTSAIERTVINDLLYNHVYVMFQFSFGKKTLVKVHTWLFKQD